MFSGDAFQTWETLGYEIYSTPLHANALVGFLSHDIGGFEGTPDPEGFKRWGIKERYAYTHGRYVRGFYYTKDLKPHGKWRR